MNKEYTLFQPPKTQSTLHIHGNYLQIMFPKKRPNFVWRFFQYILLGWKWEKND